MKFMTNETCSHHEIHHSGWSNWCVFHLIRGCATVRMRFDYIDIRDTTWWNWAFRCGVGIDTRLSLMFNQQNRIGVQPIRLLTVIMLCFSRLVKSFFPLETPFLRDWAYRQLTFLCHSFVKRKHGQKITTFSGPIREENNNIRTLFSPSEMRMDFAWLVEHIVGVQKFNRPTIV